MTVPAHAKSWRTLSKRYWPSRPLRAACFGRKSKKRADQITAILATLKALGHIV